MFKRTMHTILLERLTQFPVVALTGPRQSGKTTLLKTSCPDYDYLNLESPVVYDRVSADPEGVLSKHYEKGLIIDEAQKLPELFSYVQVISDEREQVGNFILSGSQNFLLSQQITQSLAGRAGILELLPLTYAEYASTPDVKSQDVWQWLYQGAYPRPYQAHIPVDVWLDSYVQTYLERDVRDLLHVKNIEVFRKFLRLCAGRHGQLLNMSQLSIDCGISHTTLTHWLGILEASYIIFRLPPYYNNFNKRLVKSPKLYFYDSGLVCYLLGIDSQNHLSVHSARGAIFEGYVISEIKKYFLNKGRSQKLYFWRDNNGNEVDCLIEYQGKLHAIEIKSTATCRLDLLKGLQRWERQISADANLSLVYAGDKQEQLGSVDIVPWLSIASLFDVT